MIRLGAWTATNHGVVIRDWRKKLTTPPSYSSKSARENSMSSNTCVDCCIASSLTSTTMYFSSWAPPERGIWIVVQHLSSNTHGSKRAWKDMAKTSSGYDTWILHQKEKIGSKALYQPSESFSSLRSQISFIEDPNHFSSWSFKGISYPAHWRCAAQTEQLGSHSLKRTRLQVWRRCLCQQSSHPMSVQTSGRDFEHSIGPPEKGQRP